VALGLIDGGLVLTFAALVGADGFARVPERAVLFGRTLAGRWRAAPPSVRTEWRLASAWSPVRTAVVAAWAPERPVTGERLTARLQGSRALRRALGVLGALHLTLFVIGVPASVAYWGGTGLIAIVAAVTIVGIVIAGLATRAMRALGSGVGDGVGSRLARALSPFSAPTAAQDVLQAAVRDVPAALVAAALLPAEEYARWLRPFAWDHLHRAPDAALAAAVGDAQLAHVARAVPTARDETARAYCARCAGEFATVTAQCPVCTLDVVPFGTHEG
jgi:hypothetical protein